MECGAYLCYGMGKGEGEVIYQQGSILSHYTLSIRMPHPSIHLSIHLSIHPNWP